MMNDAMRRAVLLVAACTPGAALAALPILAPGIHRTGDALYCAVNGPYIPHPYDTNRHDCPLADGGTT